MAASEEVQREMQTEVHRVTDPKVLLDLDQPLDEDDLYFLKDEAFIIYGKKLKNGRRILLPGSINLWEKVLSIYFCSGRGGDRDEYPRKAPKEINRGIGLGDLTFGVRCVFYFPGHMVFNSLGSIFHPSEPKPYERAILAKLWEESANFMLQYLKILRNKQGKRKAMYGAVAVKRFVRFYSLEYGTDALKTLGPDTRPLDFQREMAEVHRILNYIANGCSNRLADRYVNGYFTGEDINIFTPTELSVCHYRNLSGRVISCRCDGFKFDRDYGNEEWNAKYGECSKCRHYRSCHALSNAPKA